MGLSREELAALTDERARSRREPKNGAGRPRRVSMADVAARAGVSGQTVSRVANGSTHVDPRTRARVEQAMAQLGYRPHRAARALRTGRTQTIGLIAATLVSVGNSRMLQGVADAAAAEGYALTVVTLGGAAAVTSGPPPDAASITEAYERLHEQGVDGVIVLNEATASARDAAAPAGMAVVVVDSPLPAAHAGGLTVVQTDHLAGAAAATEHLLALGHRSIAHLAGPDGSFAAAERERGWRAALEDAGAAASTVVRGDWSAASGHAAGIALAADPSLTAVFAANDQMALGLLRALADAGRAVPGEVSVVGFDDVADAADYRPPLTTVRQDFDVLGARAVAALTAAITGAPGTVDVVSGRLIVRESTATPLVQAPAAERASHPVRTMSSTE